MEPKYFVGVDISKLTLDLALLHSDNPVKTFKIKNEENSIREFLKLIKTEYGFKSREIVFCAENMGIYSDHLTNVLISKKITICLESALQIKKSLGIRRGKNDRLDSIRIVDYTRKNYKTLRIWEPPRECIQELKQLTTLRRRLLKIKKMLTNEEKVRSHFLGYQQISQIKSYYDRSLRSIDEDLRGLDEKMRSIVSSDEKLSNLVTLITSVPCIGQVIAFRIIIATNEFKNISSPKKFASYCGVAPFEWTSGSSIMGKTRVSFYANKEIKAYLHLAAMLCVRKSKGQLHEYYLRKQKEGKNNMAILNAIRNKLIHRIFSCVNNNQVFKVITKI